MKIVVMFVGLFWAAISLAQGEISISEIKQLSQSVNKIVQDEAEQMSPEALAEVKSLLNSVKFIVRGEVGSGRVSCSTTRYRDENAYSATYTYLNDYASAYSGLNMYDDEAIKFTLDWLSKYPCDFAETFTREIGRLLEFAYSSNHLNLYKKEARAFALEHIYEVCVDVDYEKLYNRTFYHAYSVSGLNMSSKDAHAYTRPIVFKEMFGCQFPAK